MDIEKNRNELINDGWSMLEAKLNDIDLKAFSEKFGTILPDDNGNVIQYLKPKSHNEGIRDSLSFNFGYSNFPYHTDTAFWSLPARYLIMTSQNRSNCNTGLFDCHQIFDACSNSELLELKKSVFLQKTYVAQKFTSLIINENGVMGIRYDPNIMFPMNNNSKKAVEIINHSIKKMKSIEIEWTGNNIVLVDNWRFLHSRGDASIDKNRIIKRIYLKQSI